MSGPFGMNSKLILVSCCLDLSVRVTQVSSKAILHFRAEYVHCMKQIQTTSLFVYPGGCKGFMHFASGGTVY